MYDLAEMSRLRRLRSGDTGTIIESVKQTYIASTVRGVSRTQSTRLGEAIQQYEESTRNFLPMNELGPIIDKRVEETPSAWAYCPIKPSGAAEVEDSETEVPQSGAATYAEKFCADLNEWASTPQDDSLDLFNATPEIEDDQEESGTAAIVLGRDPITFDVWFQVRDTAAITYQRRADNPNQLESVTFRWSQAQDAPGADQSKPLVYEETITSSRRTISVDGKEVPEETRSYEDLGTIPVVLIPRRKLKGTVLGDSGVAELEQAQNAHLMALHLLFTNCKYAAAPVMCPDPQTDQGEFTGDQDNDALSTLAVGPGVFIPFPVKQIGGNANSPDLHALINMTLRSLRRQGKVREEGDGTADARSGKAMLVGSEAMRTYVNRKLVFLRLGFKRLATIWGLLTGRLKPGESAPVQVEFETGDDDDAQETTKRAEFWLKMAAAGKCTNERLYIELQRIGMVDEDADPEALAAEVDAAEAEAAQQSADRFLAATKAQAQQPKPDMPAQGPGQPPSRADMPMMGGGPNG